MNTKAAQIFRQMAVDKAMRLQLLQKDWVLRQKGDRWILQGKSIHTREFSSLKEAQYFILYSGDKPCK